MAQNVTIAGASYTDVPAIDVPKTDGGSARFIDTSDANATSNKIASGYSGYVNGQKVNGSLVEQSAKTVTPTTSSQIAVESGQYTTGAVTVAAVQTETKSMTLGAAAPSAVTPTSGKFLTSVSPIIDTSVINPSNIVKDAVILGVTGSYDCIPKRGTAVVFGDSIFTHPELGYNFADYLEGQGIYNTVIDHAHGGTGFGETSSPYTGNNLYQLIQTQAVQDDIADADDIYIGLGGNDVLSKINGTSSESALSTKVSTIFTTISTLNPDALIYFVPTYPAIQPIMQLCNFRSHPENGKAALDAFNDINIAVANATNNIKIHINQMDSLFGIHHDDGLHPTAVSVENAYDDVIFGAYRDKKLRDLIVFYDASHGPASEYMNKVANCASARVIDSEADFWIVLDTTTRFYPNRALKVGCDYDGTMAWTLESFDSSSYIKMIIKVYESAGPIIKSYFLTPPTPLDE